MEYKIEGKGVIEYSSPSIPNRLRILDKLGMTPNNLDIDMDFNTMASLVELSGDLVERVDIKIDDRKIESWADLMKEDSMVSDVLQLAMAIVMPPKKGEEVKKS